MIDTVLSEEELEQRVIKKVDQLIRRKGLLDLQDYLVETHASLTKRMSRSEVVDDPAKVIFSYRKIMKALRGSFFHPETCANRIRVECPHGIYELDPEKNTIDKGYFGPKVRTSCNTKEKTIELDHVSMHTGSIITDLTHELIHIDNLCNLPHWRDLETDLPYQRGCVKWALGEGATIGLTIQALQKLPRIHSGNMAHAIECAEVNLAAVYGSESLIPSGISYSARYHRLFGLGTALVLLNGREGFDEVFS